MSLLDILLLIFIMLIFLLLKGFFSGSEIALVNADKIKLRHKSRQGHKGAKEVTEEHREKTLKKTPCISVNPLRISV